MLNTYAHGVPMSGQKKQPDLGSLGYSLMSPTEAVRHQRNEMDLALSATEAHGKHILKHYHAFSFNPMRFYYKMKTAKSLDDMRFHNKNVAQLNAVQREGAVYMSKSPSGKKKQYTAITKDIYDKLSPHYDSTGSTSNAE